MKKRLFIFILCLVIINLTACKDNTQNELSTIEKIHLRLTNLTQYKTNATIIKYSNKGKNEYETVQFYNMNGDYKIEFNKPKTVIGNTISHKNEITTYYDNEIGEEIILKTGNEFSEMMLGSFVKNYLSSKEESAAVSNLNESNDANVTILEAVIPGDYIYMSSEKLWIDNKSLDPLKLVIYDKDGNERTVVSYSNFEYNLDMDF